MRSLKYNKLYKFSKLTNNVIPNEYMSNSISHYIIKNIRVFLPSINNNEILYLLNF